MFQKPTAYLAAASIRPYVMLCNESGFTGCEKSVHEGHGFSRAVKSRSYEGFSPGENAEPERATALMFCIRARL